MIFVKKQGFCWRWLSVEALYDWWALPWMLQITCSTVCQVLDPVLKQETLVIGSAYGKKKKKSGEYQKSNLHGDEIYKGENALSFLSSLLDILLLKKDMANRSVFVRLCDSRLTCRTVVYDLHSCHFMKAWKK